MRLLPVYEHPKLEKDNLWATIRSKVVELLDSQSIRHSSVDLVRFSWLEENENDKGDKNDKGDEDDEGDEDSENNEDSENDEDIDDLELKVTPFGTVVRTPITIWVGVLPGTLSGEEAYHSSEKILEFLKEHGIFDVDIAYRESVARAFSSPDLFAPVSDLNPLKAVIDPVTTALGLPIAGFGTPNTEGTMGFYFEVDQDLYAVTARHVLFPEDRGNEPYSYTAGHQKKEVVLMGTRAFSNFLTSIKGHIGILNNTVGVLENRAAALTTRSEGSGPNAEQAAGELAETKCELGKIKTAIEELKKFFLKMRKEWANPKDRVFGHIFWAPPISVSTAPDGYTKDICVIKLDQRRFLRNFRGNVIDLGPEIDAGKFVSLMYPRIDAPTDFRYPLERLLKLRDILSAEERRTPNNQDHNGDPTRYVIKRGMTTLTTIGRLNRFDSHVRHYSTLGHRDSVEVAIYPYDSNCGPFARGGDSGSIIVDARGKFVALLTGGTGATDSSDITYGSPMCWLWEILTDHFPGANLNFEDNGS